MHMREGRLETRKKLDDKREQDLAQGDVEVVLPEDKTAEELLNDVSDKDRERIAQSQGLTLAVYDKYLRARASRERVARAVNEAKDLLSAGKSVEKSPYDKQAEDAVIKGIRHAVTTIEAREYSTKHAEKLFEEAYNLFNKSEAEESPEGKKQLHEAAVWRFHSVVRSRSVQEVLDLVHGGATFREAHLQMSDILKKRAATQNIPDLKKAYEQMAESILTDEFVEEANEKLQMLASLKEGQEPGPELRELLDNLIKAAKGGYFKNRITTAILDRYGLKAYRMHISEIVRAYAKYGPHKKSIGNVSGPTEVYGSIQSGDRNSGYNRTGKNRPHRGTPDDERF